MRRGPDEPDASAPGPPPDLANRRVLVVEDEDDTRDLIAFILEQCEAVVTTAASGHEALRRLESERFDVLVSDIGMPGLDGLSMIRLVRQLPAEQGGRLPAVALTAYTRAEDKAQALRAGFDMHLGKPVDPSELAHAIAAVIGDDQA